MAGLIYYIRSKTTGRVYVGSTTRTAKQRFAEHLHYLRKGNHHSKHLQRVYDKYGEADFDFSVILEHDGPEPLLDIEQSHIDMFVGSCMNGVPVSDSIYAAHAANRGRVQTKEERERRSESAKTSIREGRAIRGPWSEERKAAHSIRLTGRKMPPVTDAQRANISKALRAMHERLGTSAKKKTGDKRTDFIEKEMEHWASMKADGKSIREIERLTGRCRKVIARAMKDVAP